MKSRIILFALVVFFLGTEVVAQTASLANVSVPEKTTTPAPAELALLAQQHNRLAVRQITDHLNDNIVYPKEMEQFTLEGTVTLQIFLDRRGTIKQVKVHSTELPESFSETALKVMSDLSRIRTTEGAYYGKGTFNIPLHFSL